MANRSYLYSTDLEQIEQKKNNEHKILGLSEYSYSIPLSYKILVSQQPKLSPSIIWNFDQPLAIQGDFKLGKQKLLDFIHRLEAEELLNPERLKQYRVETIDFLNQHELPYIILECGEIFEMENKDLGEQNVELFQQIADIDVLIEEFISKCKQLKQGSNNESASIKKKKSKGFLSKLFARKEKQSMPNELTIREDNLWQELGIDYWSTILYFDFSHNN